MPPKNYVNMSVRREVKEALARLKNELGFSSESDVIVYLLRVYEEREGAISVLNSVSAHHQSWLKKESSSKVTRLIERSEGGGVVVEVCEG